jgi:hypothetical protein
MHPSCAAFTLEWLWDYTRKLMHRYGFKTRFIRMPRVADNIHGCGSSYSPKWNLVCLDKNACVDTIVHEFVHALDPECELKHTQGRPRGWYYNHRRCDRKTLVTIVQCERLAYFLSSIACTELALTKFSITSRMRWIPYANDPCAIMLAKTIPYRIGIRIPSCWIKNYDGIFEKFIYLRVITDLINGRQSGLDHEYLPSTGAVIFKDDTRKGLDITTVATFYPGRLEEFQQLLQPYLTWINKDEE